MDIDLEEFLVECRDSKTKKVRMSEYDMRNLAQQMQEWEQLYLVEKEKNRKLNLKVDRLEAKCEFLEIEKYSYTEDIVTFERRA